MVDVSKCLRLIWRICTWKGQKKRLPSSNLQRAGGFRQGSGPVVEISNFGLFETYEILTMNLLIQFPKRRSRSFPETRMAGFVIRNFIPKKNTCIQIGWLCDWLFMARKNRSFNLIPKPLKKMFVWVYVCWTASSSKGQIWNLFRRSDFHGKDLPSWDNIMEVRNTLEPHFIDTALTLL